MHFEILVEDISGKRMLDILLGKILPGNDHTFKTIAYKGIGRIPKGLKTKHDVKKRILLDRLPSALRGYGKSFQHFPAAVIIVCDLDDKCLKAFREELFEILNNCVPQPTTHFCVLGDIPAIKKAYPKANKSVLNSYQQDSICGTWEKLADAVYPGGSKALPKGPIAGIEKSRWAENISPHMDIRNNQSPSFCYFRETLKKLLDQSSE
jgi:hypothetical protein